MATRERLAQTSKRNTQIFKPQEQTRNTQIFNKWPQETAWLKRAIKTSDITASNLATSVSS